MQFTTAETGYGKGPEDVVRDIWSGPTDPAGNPLPPLGPHPPAEISTEAVGHAIVRQRRWVVLCPWCPSAQYAHTTDKRFFCVECGNAAVGGKWVAVEWPPNPEEIERTLMVRPSDNRNWEWGETVADLVAENFEHGVGGLVKP